MRRREFVTLIGGAALTWPLAGQAQNAPRVGWIFPGASAGNPTELAGFKEGLRELGYVEGRNIVVEYRFGEHSAERLPEFATELARLNVNVIVALGETAIRAARRAAPDTPIVFLSADPVGAGLVTNLSRPGGNMTGVSAMRGAGKWPELAKQALPGAHPRRLPHQSDECGERHHLERSASLRRGARVGLPILPGRTPGGPGKCICCDDAGRHRRPAARLRPIHIPPTGRRWRGSRSGTSSRRSQRYVNSRSRAA